MAAISGSLRIKSARLWFTGLFRPVTTPSSWTIMSQVWLDVWFLDVTIKILHVLAFSRKKPGKIHRYGRFPGTSFDACDCNNTPAEIHHEALTIFVPHCGQLCS